MAAAINARNGSIPLDDVDVTRIVPALQTPTTFRGSLR